MALRVNGDLRFRRHELVQLGLDVSEHQLDGVELRSVRRQGHGHESSVPAEILDSGSGVDGGVVEDEHELSPVGLKVGPLEFAFLSQELFHLTEELDECILRVGTPSELAHVHAFVCEGADGVRLI